jgi:hypothetical protein
MVRRANVEGDRTDGASLVRPSRLELVRCGVEPCAKCSRSRRATVQKSCRESRKPLGVTAEGFDHELRLAAGEIVVQ